MYICIQYLPKFHALCEEQLGSLRAKHGADYLLCIPKGFTDTLKLRLTSCVNRNSILNQILIF